ncbi:MAG: hypothetical protein IGS39_09615 [Calothrix sp. C42_A2020_038]|nr:hypothetical protein [Calothrix sp. C42_A2020_038]
MAAQSAQQTFQQTLKSVGESIISYNKQEKPSRAFQGALWVHQFGGTQTDTANWFTT